MSRGKHNKRIQIQEEQEIRNPNTKLIESTWVTIYTCWAFLPQTASLYKIFQASAAHLENTIWFEIRYKEGLRPGMRVFFNDQSYEIQNVNLDYQRKEVTLLQCKEVI
jgi:SPP1 family predicted phage head-tail adaptor